MKFVISLMIVVSTLSGCGSTTQEKVAKTTVKIESEGEAPASERQVMKDSFYSKAHERVFHRIVVKKGTASHSLCWSFIGRHGGAYLPCTDYDSIKALL